ncbi:unnamed protein product [Caenorhabditis bovis]|uniref:Uncharacterized protein n=1 Tax=Caenorhabditis bovis TaxID=2654633 RepID=A0A8S1FCJ1_9PELO|nr:unnamed protein product [Caenorhabditis bovis]
MMNYNNLISNGQTAGNQSAMDQIQGLFESLSLSNSSQGPRLRAEDNTSVIRQGVLSELPALTSEYKRIIEIANILGSLKHDEIAVIRTKSAEHPPPESMEQLMAQMEMVVGVVEKMRAEKRQEH